MRWFLNDKGDWGRNAGAMVLVRMNEVVIKRLFVLDFPILLSPIKRVPVSRKFFFFFFFSLFCCFLIMQLTVVEITKPK
jgi:hypothetical protein